MKIKTITLALVFAVVSPVIAEEATTVSETQEQTPVTVKVEEVSVSATEQETVKAPVVEDAA